MSWHISYSVKQSYGFIIGEKGDHRHESLVLLKSFQGLDVFIEGPSTYSFPAEVIPQDLDDEPEAVKISNGLPRMIHVWVGNGRDLVHCNTGATNPEWDRFVDFKAIWEHARTVRFGGYGKLISDALRKFREIEGQELQKAEKSLNEKYRDKSTPKKERSKARAAAKIAAAQLMHRDELYQDRNERGQAYQGHDFVARIKCRSCEALFPYKEFLEPTEEEHRREVMRKTGRFAKADEKCAEAATSLACRTLKATAREGDQSSDSGTYR